jgi:hypothetical protein
MASYMESLGEMSSSARSAGHAANIIAAMTPPPRNTSVNGDDSTAIVAARPVSAQPKESVGKSILGLAPGVVAGAAGALSWKSHRVLGFLGGHAIGSNVYPMFRGNEQERKSAMCRLGVEGAGIAGALVWKKHSLFGWLAGIAVGMAAVSLVPGNPVLSELKKMKEKL